MKILIVYASNSGSTKTVANIIGQVLEHAQEHKITIKDARETEIEDIQINDVIMLGSPSWKVKDKEGQPLESMSTVISKIKEARLFEKKLWAAFGCGDRSYLNFCMAVDIIEEHILTNGGKLLDHGLRIDSFYFDQEKNEQLAAEWAEQLAKKLPVSSIV